MLVTLSLPGTPLSWSAGRSSSGASGATVSKVIASVLLVALWLPARSTTQAVYVQTPCRPSGPRPPWLSAAGAKVPPKPQPGRFALYAPPVSSRPLGEGARRDARAGSFALPEATRQ